jgi:hypothetical protein
MRELTIGKKRTPGRGWTVRLQGRTAPAPALLQNYTV